MTAKVPCTFLSPVFLESDKQKEKWVKFPTIPFPPFPSNHTSNRGFYILYSIACEMVSNQEHGGQNKGEAVFSKTHYVKEKVAQFCSALTKWYLVCRLAVISLDNAS